MHLAKRGSPDWFLYQFTVSSRGWKVGGWEPVGRGVWKNLERSIHFWLPLQPCQGFSGVQMLPCQPAQSPPQSHPDADWQTPARQGPAQPLLQTHSPFKSQPCVTSSWKLGCFPQTGIVGSWDFPQLFSCAVLPAL